MAIIVTFLFGYLRLFIRLPKARILRFIAVRTSLAGLEEHYSVISVTAAVLFKAYFQASPGHVCKVRLVYRLPVYAPG